MAFVFLHIFVIESKGKTQTEIWELLGITDDDSDSNEIDGDEEGVELMEI
jgi:hypothetical protein